MVESIGATDDADRLTIKRVVEQAGLRRDGPGGPPGRGPRARSRPSTELAKPTAELLATQDRIIDVLRRLLGEIRKESADLLAEMKKRPDTELPADVKDKLSDLKDKLDEFLKQQKKVIEATENLAKKPVEDFTEKDKQLLKDLAAAEDEWSKFMADKHTDLSKLPEQDFSNPSLLKELVEVQTELKMAKDALTKKTADIAVPLEQLGAEMAKEMTTNIEKWLPDTPDREKWSQEEPLTDDMKEAPMAELPKEMEDIVGKLMEDEEDLFDEMEDASSSWADSLDKGAGWDAMDGPISNNSARGVTGNRLPNTSEIAGRSGEGRQGKSSGEFVGDTAVGKGGRKTPSRLTPDAYVKGQIKDYSKDPVGGATGGGKESGGGGEGLQRPVPNRPERDLGRLASQAGPAPQQGRGGRPQVPGPQVPPHRPEADDRRDGRRRDRPQGRPLPQRPAPPRRPARGPGPGQDVPQGRVHRPPGPDRQPAHRHPEGDPRQHAGALPRRLGGTEPAVLRAADTTGARIRAQATSRASLADPPPTGEEVTTMRADSTSATVMPRRYLGPATRFHRREAVGGRSAQEGRDPVRLRVEVRRRRVRPEHRRHALGEAPSPGGLHHPRDRCRTSATGASGRKMIPGPDTPLERMKEIVVKEQAGDIGIWGKVERVQGFDEDVYDLWINVADFSVNPPRMIYQKKARTQTVSEIPHVYVKEALDRLYGRTEQVAGEPSTPSIQERWEKAPNLVQGRFRAGPQGAGRLGSPAPRRDLGAGEGKDAKIAEQGHPLHHERGRGRDDGRALLQRLLPGRGGGHLPLPVPLADAPARPPRSSSSATTSCRPSSAPRSDGRLARRPRSARSTATSRTSRATPASGTSRPRTSRPRTPSSLRAGAG